jgi:hypothetical protein
LYFLKKKYVYISTDVIPDPSHFEVVSAITKLRRYKSLHSDQILAELIEAEGETLQKIHKRVN